MHFIHSLTKSTVQFTRLPVFSVQIDAKALAPYNPKFTGEALLLEINTRNILKTYRHVDWSWILLGFQFFPGVLKCDNLHLAHLLEGWSWEKK